MAEKSYFSTIVLGVIFAGLAYMTSLGTEHSGGWLVLTSFFGCGFFAQILVVNGIMQATPVNQMPGGSNVVAYNRTAVDYRNYHYRSIIAKVNSSGVTVTTVDEAIRTYSSLFNVGEKAAKPFFNNQFVMSTLGLSHQGSAQVTYQSKESNLKSEKENSGFWGNVSQGGANNEAKSGDTCAGHGCSNAISAFDFRCYQCRERFCESCKGSGLNCPSCS